MAACPVSVGATQVSVVVLAVMELAVSRLGGAGSPTATAGVAVVKIMDGRAHNNTSMLRTDLDMHTNRPRRIAKNNGRLSVRTLWA